MSDSIRTGSDLGHFLRDERGAELVEWMMVTVIVGLAGYAVLMAVREELVRAFTNLLDDFIDFTN